MSHEAPAHAETHHEPAAHGGGHGEHAGGGHGEAHAPEAHGAAHAAEAHGGAHAAEAHGGAHATEAHGAAHAAEAHGSRHGAHAAEAHGAHPPTKPTAQSEFAREARAAWERTKKSSGGFLLAENEPPKEVPFYKTPFYIIRDWVRGSIGNVYRRAKEIIEPARDCLQSAWNTISKPITSPVKTLFHPVSWAANIPRIFTAGTKTIKNTLKAPASGVDEAYTNIVQVPVQRVDYNIANVPPKKVTGMIAKFNNKVASVLGWPARAANKAAKWATNWIDNVDGYFGAATQGA